jgi:hypothetical protein
MAVSPQLLERIRGEFLEMPGMKLTTAQACRLWNLKEVQCREALDALIADGFLFRTPSAAFIALPSATRMVKANVSDAARAMRCSHCQHLNPIPIDQSIRIRVAIVTFRCAACGQVLNAA